MPLQRNLTQVPELRFGAGLCNGKRQRCSHLLLQLQTALWWHPWNLHSALAIAVCFLPFSWGYVECIYPSINILPTQPLTFANGAVPSPLAGLITIFPIVLTCSSRFSLLKLPRIHWLHDLGNVGLLSEVCFCHSNFRSLLCCVYTAGEASELNSFKCFLKYKKNGYQLMWPETNLVLLSVLCVIGGRKVLITPIQIAGAIKWLTMTQEHARLTSPCTSALHLQ